MNAADTNILVRIVVRDDARQALAADRFLAEGAWVSLLALAETAWVLSSVYGHGPEPLAAGLEMLLHHEHLVHQDPGVASAALELFRQRPQLGFFNCLLLEQARAAGNLPFGTFDRELAKAPGAKML